MTLYHVTSCNNATQILEQGFHDPNGGRFADACVWFADIALCNDAMFDDEQTQSSAGPRCAVVVDIPDEVIDEFEDKMFHGEHSDHREWCIPYDVANQYLKSARIQKCP